MDYRAEATKRVRQVVAEANEKFGLNLDPKIYFNLRGRTAGWAKPWSRELNFNYDLMVANWGAFDNTFIHEVAHLVDAELHPENFEPPQSFVPAARWGIARRPKRNLHGATWKAIMKKMGGDPRRTHTYDTSATTVRRSTTHKWVGTCGCTMELGPKRHRKMKNGLARYWLRGHANCQYVYEGAEQPRRAAAEAKRPSTRKASGTTLREQAAAIFRQVNGIRGAFISLCESNLGMKKNTASSYHHNFKSGKWTI